jgi:hypothetical protein
MASTVLIKTNNNNVPQSAGRWLRGEPVAVVDSMLANARQEYLGARTTTD